MFKQMVQHHLGISVAFDLNDQTHAAAVRLVAYIGNIGNLFIAHQGHDAFNQRGFVDLVRNGGHNNSLAAAFSFFNFRGGLHAHAAAAGFKIIMNAFGAADDGAGREIRPFDDFHHLFGGNARIFNIRDNTVADFAQVVRGDVGSHTHGDTGRAVDQQRRQFGRQHRRLHQRPVIVGNHFDGVFFQIIEHFVRNALQAAFGIAHGGGGVPVNGAEVPLPVN